MLARRGRFSWKHLDRRHFVHQSSSASGIVQKAETEVEQAVDATRIRSLIVDRSAIEDSRINEGAVTRHTAMPAPLLLGGRDRDAARASLAGRPASTGDRGRSCDFRRAPRALTFLKLFSSPGANWRAGRARPQYLGAAPMPKPSPKARVTTAANCGRYRATLRSETTNPSF